MTDHDLLCPFPGHRHDGCITCDLIVKVRADERKHMESDVYIAMMERNLTDQIVREEREKIAAAIKKAALPWRYWPNGEQSNAYRHAARIARNGGGE